MYFIVLWISYVFLCFLTFCFCVFFRLKFVAGHFLKHNNAKTNSFQPLRVKISIFNMNYVKKLNLHWFCTQNHILEPFSVRRACTKSYVTSEPYHPGVTNLVSKCAGNLKEKSHKVSRRELCALQSNRAKCRGGGPFRPPPPVFLGLKARFSKWVKWRYSNLIILRDRRELIIRLDNVYCFTKRK